MSIDNMKYLEDNTEWYLPTRDIKKISIFEKILLFFCKKNIMLSWDANIIGWEYKYLFKKMYILREVKEEK